MVMVADWRLGALRYLLMLATFLYIIIYAIYYERGYLDIQSPVGSVTASLQRPPNANVNAKQFAYCNASIESQNYSDPLLCEVWPEDMVLFPTAIHEHMLITTRVSEQWEILNSDCIYQNFGQNSLTNCNGNVSYVVSSTPKRYLAGLENYTIEITHAMLDLKHYEITGHEKYCLTGEQMDGKLLDSDDNEIKHFPANQPLIITLSELLNAADTDLSDLSDAESYNDSIYRGETMRHSGILLMVMINYDNTYSTNNRNPIYTVKAIRIKQAEYKSVETIYYNQTYRMIRDRHGIYISFIQGGRIGKFNFQTALISLVASLGLLGISTLLVDSLMLYFCKHKANYYNDKYDFTEVYAKDPKLKISLSLRKNLHHKKQSDSDSINNSKQEDLLQPGSSITTQQPQQQNSSVHSPISNEPYYSINSSGYSNDNNIRSMQNTKYEM